MSDSLPQVNVDQLRVGVFVSLNLSWSEHPFIVNSFLIKNEKQLRTLRELGLREITYDPQRSEVPPLPADEASSGAVAPGLEADNRLVIEEKQKRAQRMGEQRERLQRCEKEYGDCVGVTKDALRSIMRDPVHAAAQTNKIVADLASSFLDAQGATVVLMASRKIEESSTQHALNVMVLTMLLGRSLGVKREILEVAGAGALLHDIGKAKINPSVLHNPQRSRHEEALYRVHGEYGLQIVGNHVAAPVRAVIREHHEYVDGSGFPAGLKDKQINPIARMVTIANHYDNLCNPSILNDALTPAEALSRMFAREGARFDKTMLAAFIKELGIYPPGSFVRLSTGSIGIVVAVTPGNTLKPSVMVYEPGVPRAEALVVDLSETDAAVESVLRPATLPQKTVEYLNPRMKLAYFAQRVGG